MIAPALAQEIGLKPALATPQIFTPQFVAGLLIFGIAAMLLAGLVFFLRRFLRSGKRVPVAFHRTILLVTLPKESAEQEQKEERATEKNLEEKLFSAEALMNVLGGIKAQRGFGAFWTGRYDHFSFEIVAHEGLISFYVVVPSYMREFIEEQIHAQYPTAQIDEVEDYNIFGPKNVILGTTLVFRKPYIFPIKTYRNLNVDPLSSITNSLSRIDTGDGAAIQFVVRSAKASWHNWGARVAREMQQGKKLREAMGRRGVWGIGQEIFRTFFPKKRPQDMAEDIYRLSPMEEQIVKGLEEKTSKAGLDLNVRIIVSAKTSSQANQYLKNIVDSFSQYTLYEYGNGFSRRDPLTRDGLIRNFIYRNFKEGKRMVVNTEEMASLFHFPLPETETPNIRWLMARRAPPPVNIPKEGLILGKNVYRGVETLIKIKDDDRRRHIYMIGMTGTGKSTLIQEMVKQDIRNGKGVCVVDPHGPLVEDILECVPPERMDDVVYFNPADTERPIGLNMLEAETPEQADFAVQEMIAIFYKLVTDPSMIGPMFEHNMRNAMLTLMADKQYPGTITEIPRIFTDPGFQKYKLTKVTDPMVRAFWEKEMAKTSDFHKSEMLGYLISKVGRFVENEMMRNIIGQPKSGFNFREIMDNQKILLINLSKGKVGEVNSNLLGLIIVSKLQMAALARADMPERERHDFYLYIDEFQNFITDSISTILAEARKYKLNLVMAHQYINQLISGASVEGKGGDTRIKDAVFGNAGTMICFRIGVDDAEVMAKQFTPIFNEYDLINIDRFNAYTRLLIDNTASKPFNMVCLPPTRGKPEIAQKLKQLSRLKFGREQKAVEAEILERSRLGEPSATQGPNVGERNL